MAPRIIAVSPFDLVVFGATGDLSRRKLLPALFNRDRHGQIPAEARIIGASRTQMSEAEFRTLARTALEQHARIAPEDSALVTAFLKRLTYVTLDAGSDEGWDELEEKFDASGERVRVFYLATAPELFGPICDRLKLHGLATPQARVVVEKPIGKDGASAGVLNESIAETFPEARIYRIDHYLGKETVQNLMAVRFANILFEPLWKSEYVDHVQITVAETVGVDGRGAYYDKSGAMRDMVQNHMMQLLCLIAMEPPYHFDPDAVRDEKLKVIRALEPVQPADIVRGQYAAGGGEKGYVEHSENPASRTESYIALKVNISNWRWQGTPFYLRTGKRLRARASEISITFKQPPHKIFDDAKGWHENVLVIRLQPDEGMNLKVMIKEPGPGGMRLMQVPLDMSFADALGAEAEDVPDAYERLIMDVIRGNQTLFMRGDEVEAAWAWTDPIIQGWEARNDKPQSYDPGTSGPEDALMLMHRDGRRWREIK